MATISCHGCGAEVAADQRYCPDCIVLHGTEDVTKTERIALDRLLEYTRRIRAYNALIDTPGWTMDSPAYLDAVYRMEWAEQALLDAGEILLQEHEVLHGNPDSTQPRPQGIMDATRSR